MIRQPDAQSPDAQTQDAAPDPANPRAIRSIGIVGGGTAGWMAAAMLARALHGRPCRITVIESPEIGTVGVGEATIPPIIDLLKFLDINEADFIRRTSATYKLGIVFQDWGAVGDRYWHPFGTFGAPINRRPFHHAFARALATAGPDTRRARFNDFSLAAALGDAGLYRPPESAGSGPGAGLRYALHFDAGLVAAYLGAYARHLGVARLEDTVQGVTLAEDGAIAALQFAGREDFTADLYLDCSGFRGLLIEQAQKTGYLSWSRHLPCDRAVALPTAVEGPRPPYTRAAARSAGWQWRIPLQHRVGNGHVYSSAHMEDAAALDDLLAVTGQTPLAEPRLLRFATGRRRLFWNRNCVALGLASGFLEPLESTSIHLVMSGVYNLLDHFPDRDFAPANIAAYNRELIEEMEHIRDFIILHYGLTRRTDSAFWRDCAATPPPDSLAERIAVYRETGRVGRRAGELFTDLSWFYIFEGMGVRPAGHDPLIDVVPPAQLAAILSRLAGETAAALRPARPQDSWFAPAPALTTPALATHVLATHVP